MSDTKRKTFSGFDLTLSTGSKRKQKLSNYLEIGIASDRGVTAQKLTLREAKALQKWLNDNLESEAASAE